MRRDRAHPITVGLHSRRAKSDRENDREREWVESFRFGARRDYDRPGPRVGGQDLTFCHVFRQICLAEPIAAASVHATRADAYGYTHGTALSVTICVDPRGSNAFARSMFRKSEQSSAKRRR